MSSGVLGFPPRPSIALSPKAMCRPAAEANSTSASQRCAERQKAPGNPEPSLLLKQKVPASIGCAAQSPPLISYTMQSPSLPPMRRCAGAKAAASARRSALARSIFMADALIQAGASSASVCQSKLADTKRGDTSCTTRETSTEMLSGSGAAAAAARAARSAQMRREGGGGIFGEAGSQHSSTCCKKGGG